MSDTPSDNPTGDATPSDHLLPPDFRAGYAAVIGLPNAGKSTLLNHFLQTKLSIVPRKPQTTRQNVLGILNQPGLQIIFMDTPGILTPRYSLQEAMMRQVQSAMTDADVLIYVVDVTEKAESPDNIAAVLKRVACPVILVLNKIDLMDSKTLLPIMDRYKDARSFRSIVPVSALKDSGLDRVVSEAAACMPLSPPYYPTDYISTQQERFFVAEIIREKIFKYYGKEIPYATHVEIEDFKEREKGKTYIRAAILIERSSQKAIIIGKQGKALKRVGELARGDMERFLDRPVFLELFVKVSSDWRKKAAVLKRMGYSE